MLVGFLFAVLFLVTAEQSVLLPLLPVIGSQLDLSLQAASLLVSFYAVGAGLFNLLFGPLTDRFGRQGFLKIGLTVFMIVSLTQYLIQEFWLFLILRLLAGICAGVISTCTAGLVGDLFSYKRRGRVMGSVLSAYYAALIFGVPLGSWISEAWGWQSVFLVSSAGSVALIVVSLMVLPEGSGQGSALSTRVLVYPQFFKRKDTAGALLVSFLISGGTLAILTFVSPYLSQRFELSTLGISQLFVVVGLGAALTSPLAGYLSDRFTKRMVFLVANSTLSLPLLLLTAPAWGLGLVTLFFFVGVLVSFRQTALQTIQTELPTDRERGAFLALRNSSSQLGIAVAVQVAGYLYTAFGYLGVTVFAAVLTFLASLLFWLSVSEPDLESAR